MEFQISSCKVFNNTIKLNSIKKLETVHSQRRTNIFNEKFFLIKKNEQKEKILQSSSFHLFRDSNVRVCAKIIITLTLELYGLFSAFVCAIIVAYRCRRVVSFVVL